MKIHGCSVSGHNFTPNDIVYGNMRVKDVIKAHQKEKRKENVILRLVLCSPFAILAYIVYRVILELAA